MKGRARYGCTHMDVSAVHTPSKSSCGGGGAGDDAKGAISLLVTSEHLKANVQLYPVHSVISC